jgi:hypothetical protein
MNTEDLKMVQRLQSDLIRILEALKEIKNTIGYFDYFCEGDYRDRLNGVDRYLLKRHIESLVHESEFICVMLKYIIR